MLSWFLKRWLGHKAKASSYRRAKGNKSQAARLLGLSRNALRYRLEKIGIPDAPEKDETEKEPAD